MLSSMLEEKPGRIIDRVLQAVTLFTAPLPLQDDISMVVMKVSKNGTESASC
jgi:phosphoserine phosphatase RsbU/P